MLTIEMKVNGTLIGQMYAHNQGYTDNTTTECKYEYTCYMLNEGHNAQLCAGELVHKRDEGFAKLSQLLFEDAHKKFHTELN